MRGVQGAARKETRDSTGPSAGYQATPKDSTTHHRREVEGRAVGGRGGGTEPMTLDRIGAYLFSFAAGDNA